MAGIDKGNPLSSTTEQTRPQRCAVSSGDVGAASSGHPLATAAALSVLRAGGTAVDAAIAAQAMISVVMPHAAGIGGDMLALVHHETETTAVNGVGHSPMKPPIAWEADGGSAVTVPGIVPAWHTLHHKWGRLALDVLLAPAIEVAQAGYIVDSRLSMSIEAQRSRLMRNGADKWSLLKCSTGETWKQPELAQLLATIAHSAGVDGYCEAVALPIHRAVLSHGGTLSIEDIQRHATIVQDPLQVPWGSKRLWVQPPSSQGVLLAMATSWLDSRDHAEESPSDHLLVELTDAIFCHRDDVMSGKELLNRNLDVNPDKASNRGGARSYLHTAGVAVADASGMVVSSLVSVFDDFGSAVFVPECGFVLNNRAASFTTGPNGPRPHSLPVHTLAPAIITDPDGSATALATPGADGQIQTLLQIMSHLRYNQESISEAIAAPRWRSQDRQLLIEDDHPGMGPLEERGHHTTPTTPGGEVFGAVVAAGFNGGPWASGDWRREVSSGVA